MNDSDNFLIPVAMPRPKYFGVSPRRLLGFQRNMLSDWADKAYRARSLSFNLLNQKYFLCNSPDTVR